MSATRIDEILDVMRARGGRVTTARRALVSALVDANAHVTADDLAERVQRSHPDVHRSTIYRALADLEALGVIDHAHLGHGRAVYHFADDPHLHLVCEACGHVIEIPATLFASFGRRLAREYGFHLAPGHFAVTGTCSACAGSS